MKARLASTALLLFACGPLDPTSSTLPPSPPAPVTPSGSLSVLSGNRQTSDGKGATLQPLMVVLRNHAGRPQAGVFVTWIITSGFGRLVTPVTTLSNPDGVAFAVLEPHSYRVVVTASAGSGYGEPARFTTIPPAYSAFSASGLPCASPCEQLHFYVDSTFAIEHMGQFQDGRYLVEENQLNLVFEAAHLAQARAEIHRDTLTVFFSPGMQRLGYRDASYVMPRTGRAPSWTYRLARERGDAQAGQAGRPLESPLAVRVTDAWGDPVLSEPIGWTIVSGVGEVYAERFRPSRSGANGVAWSMVRPRALGALRIRASLAAFSTIGVEFTATASCWSPLTEIEFYQDPWDIWVDFLQWWGPGNGPIPLGTTVEWLNAFSEEGTVRLRSTSAPAGGIPFDTGELRAGERYRFTPSVPGTWEYEDAGTGIRGRLAVVDAPAEPRCPMP